MFLRFSVIFVLMLSFEFGALKSIANIANSDVSDILGNIKNFMKYSGINLTNFTSNESNINADHQIHLPEEEMFSRLLNAVLLFANQSNGRQTNDNSFLHVGNSNTYYTINNYYYSCGQDVDNITACVY